MTRHSKPDPLAPLRESFNVEDKRPERAYYILTCKACAGRWSLALRAGVVHGGNVLELLDHSAGCATVRGAR